MGIRHKVTQQGQMSKTRLTLDQILVQAARPISLVVTYQIGDLIVTVSILG